MLKKPEPTIDTKTAEAIEFAYEHLSEIAPAMEKDGIETALVVYQKRLSRAEEAPVPTLPGVYDDERGKAVIVEAKAGERIAHVVLVKIAEAMVCRREPLPDNLGQYIMEVVKDGPPKWKRGQGRDKFFYRDGFITVMVNEVCKTFGIPKTRSRTAKPGRDALSACSIVREAMQRLRKEGAIKSVPTERAIESICEGRAKRRGPNYDYWHMMLAVEECCPKS